MLGVLKAQIDIEGAKKAQLATCWRTYVKGSTVESSLSFSRLAVLSHAP